MNKLTIFLQPLTALYFGAQAGSTAGEMAGHNTAPESLFPLPLSTLQGILRTRLLVGSGVKDINCIDSLVGTPEKLPADWQIQGGFPAGFDNDALEIWLPIPFYLFKTHNKGNVYSFEIARNYFPHEDLCYNPDDKPCYLADEDFNKLQLSGVPGKGDVIQGWLPARNMYKILQLNDTQFQWQKGKDFDFPYPPFVKLELKPGTAIEKDNLQTKESMLYAYKYLRFKQNSGFVAWFQGELSTELRQDVLQKGFITAGRKSGCVALKGNVDLSDSWNKIAQGEHFSGLQLHLDGKNSCYAWIVFITPGYVVSNQKDKLWEELLKPLYNKARMISPNIHLQTISFLTGKPVLLTGYAMATKKRKRLFYAWPAGTSLLVKISGVTDLLTLENILKEWNNRCLYALNDTKSPFGKEFGYGHILVSAPFKETWEEQWPEHRSLYW